MVMKTYTRTSIGPVQLGPSIQEGEINNPSLIYGPRAAFPISRFAPVLVQAPRVRGSTIIPDKLYLLPGVYNASPQPTGKTYQWLRNGVPIAGATNPTYETTIDDHSRLISCFVTVTSPLGSVAVRTSNELLCQIYQSIDVLENDVYIIGGLPIDNHQHVVEFTPYLITGLPILNNISVMENDVYIIEDL